MNNLFLSCVAPRFVKEEGQRLAEAAEKCDKLTKTLLTLLQYASLQSQRTPPNFNFPVVRNPDRGAVIENIGAISPNTAARMESIFKAEALRSKKKELSKSKKVGIKAFEEELKAKKKELHRPGESRALESHGAANKKVTSAKEKYRASLGRDAVPGKGSGLPGGDRSQLRGKEVGEGERRNISSESGKRKSFEGEEKMVEVEQKANIERKKKQISKNMEKKSDAEQEVGKTRQKQLTPRENKKPSTHVMCECFHLLVSFQNRSQGPPKTLSSRNYQWRSEDKSPVLEPHPHPDVAVLLVQDSVHSQASQDSHASLPVTLTRSAGSVSSSRSPLKREYQSEQNNL